MNKSRKKFEFSDLKKETLLIIISCIFTIIASCSTAIITANFINNTTHKIDTISQEISIVQTINNSMRLLENADALYYKQQYSEAVIKYKEALNLLDSLAMKEIIRSEIYDKIYYHLGYAYNEIGLKQKDNKEQYGQSIKYFEEALKIRKDPLNYNQDAIAEIYFRLGGTHYNLKEYTKTCDYWIQSAELRSRYNTELENNIAWNYRNIGLTYDRMNDYKSSIPWYEKSVKIYSEIYGENHSTTIEVKKRLDYAKNKLN